MARFLRFPAFLASSFGPLRIRLNGYEFRISDLVPTAGRAESARGARHPGMPTPGTWVSSGGMPDWITSAACVYRRALATHSVGS